MLSKGEASANVYDRRAFAFRRLGQLELIGTTEMVRATITSLVDAKLDEALAFRRRRPGDPRT